ncbi:MAG: nucleotide-binding universal stress UspA family protein [Polaribacter sp.]|jgi:nucleotide-binding universal stress UspA family protein
MKKILVPVDFSEKSEFAAKMANNLAQKYNGAIYLLHLIELPSVITGRAEVGNYSIVESILFLRKIRQRMQEFKENFFNENLEVHYAIKLQNPYEGILKYADKMCADIILMGSKGHSTFEEIFIGSNTEKVVRSSKIPVLVVKKDNDDFKMKELVFASNFKIKENKEVFKKFLDFANHFNSNIHLLKINTALNFESTHEATEKVKNYIADFDLPKFSINIYNDLSVEKGILHFAKEINADLIAIGTNNRSGLSHLFSASVTKNLSNQALKPILTIKV